MSESTPGNMSEQLPASTLLRHVLPEQVQAVHTEEPELLPALRRTAPLHIEVGLICGGIEQCHTEITASVPVDAVAVGNYTGGKPFSADLAIDKAISQTLRTNSTGQSTQSQITGAAPCDLIITQYIERGIIRSELGQPFFLPDPRPDAAPTGRIIIVAGMGLPGRFGMSELAILSRELCWSVGRLGKKHLATVLIGAGEGNIPTVDAFSTWFYGLYKALNEARDDQHLTRITFVEYDPIKYIRMHYALLELLEHKEHDLVIDYKPLSDDEIKKRMQEGLDKQIRDLTREWSRQGITGESEAQKEMPARITLELQNKIYRFGAITATASVPEREILIDPVLISDANDELAAEMNPAMQLERGQFMERLLIPSDLHETLYSSTSLVMILDATTARIHWEMLARSGDLITDADDLSPQERFFGTGWGFTRQLRTTFAPPPEPPPPPQRVLNVLVVADTAEDAALPGARAEGIAVADLFESYNSVWSEATGNSIKVTRMIGPQAATRTNVLRELLMRQYDVLHFAGHCIYVPEDPPSSGWIFSHSECLSAYELNRIDHIPKFVFSNACESGITPERSAKSSAGMAPSFAESFFARGVSNFVCTAWPVDDAAARTFAVTFYACLLGLTPGNTAMTNQPLLIHKAIRQARLAVFNHTNYDTRTWGAYQHYGDPDYRFFDTESSSL